MSYPSRRQAAGLRREELAERAGVSAEYVKRLEQRRRHPSPGVAGALSKALHLTPGEHEQLCAAAGYAAPVPGASRMPREIPPAARRMLSRLTDVPVAVCDAAWTVLAGNDMWNARVCTAAAGHERGRNIAWRVFTEAPTSVCRTPASLAAFQLSLAADLRAAQRRYGDDPYLQELVDDLLRASAEFARLWRLPAAVADEADAVLVPGQDGGHELERDTFTLDRDIRVVVFTSRRDATTSC